MPTFEVQVQVNHTRTYTVDAEDGDEALARYAAGEAEFQDDDLHLLSTWVEQGDTAEVYSTDEAHTLLVVAEDVLPGVTKEDLRQEVEVKRIGIQDSSAPRPARQWEAPDWFLPLAVLDGYKRTNHQRAADNIEAACTAARVDKAHVIARFAEQYPVLRYSYGWSDPVAVLKGKPLAIAIADVRGRNNGRPGRPGSDPQTGSEASYGGWATQ